MLSCCAYYEQSEDVDLGCLFWLYDGTGTGRLCFEDFARFVGAFLSHPATSAEALYMHALADSNGDGGVDVNEMASALDEVSDMVAEVWHEDASNGQAALQEILRGVLERQVPQPNSIRTSQLMSHDVSLWRQCSA